MRDAWRTVQIQEAYDDLYDGPHATPKPADSGPVFLGIKNVSEDGRLDLSEIRHISGEEYPKWTKRVTPRAGDIVFSYEATLQRWQQATGYPVDSYDYYTVFAGMRYGLILSRIMVAQSQESEIQGNFAAQLLQRTLDAVA